MTSSFLQVRAPRETERTAEIRADRFRAALRSCYVGKLHAAPLNGGTRAKERKIEGDLSISADEVARCLRHGDGSHAIPLFRALATDAGVDDRISIRECEPVERKPIADAELEFNCAAAQLTVIADAARKRGSMTWIEMRRFQEAAISLEARERALILAAQFGGYDNA